MYIVYCLRNLLEKGHLEYCREDGRITLRGILDMLWWFEVDGADSESCPVAASFGIGGVEPSGSINGERLSIFLETA